MDERNSDHQITPRLLAKIVLESAVAILAMAAVASLLVYMLTRMYPSV